MAIANEMNSLIDTLSNKDIIVDNNVTQQKDKLMREIQNLEKENSQLTKTQNVLNTLDGELKETTLMTNSEYIQYIIWIIGAISIGIMTIKHMT